ncbi:membrane-spanning 4-domains subfamily A member 4A-like [Halichoeres trimaculatus]|uniref:membrane-spanning 4-domains subfamily A member 4A-like n=1 Tax=Halichoeres trimaculatus TaxID=147232 RepID=UPI003D9DBE64
MSSPASGPVPVPVSGSASTSTGGVLVLTQVIPSQPHCSPQRACVGTQSFIRGHPLAVGTVQIMIGVMALLFGIVMAIGADSLGVFSGIFVWGSGFYITAGSLTVAAGKSPSRCLVNTSLAFNVVASVVSMTALILYCMDAAGIMFYCWTSDYSSRWICDHYRVRMQGFSGVLAVFHLLEFIVTITVAGFACKATCPCCNEQVR